MVRSLLSGRERARRLRSCSYAFGNARVGRVERAENATTWTRDSSRFLYTSRERERALISRGAEEKTSGDSRRPSWCLGLPRLHLKYYTKRALKRLLNLKPTTAILGSSHPIIHVILLLTDSKSVTN